LNVLLPTATQIVAQDCRGGSHALTIEVDQDFEQITFTEGSLVRHVFLDVHGPVADIRDGAREGVGYDAGGAYEAAVADVLTLAKAHPGLDAGEKELKFLPRPFARALRAELEITLSWDPAVMQNASFKERLPDDPKFAVPVPLNLHGATPTWFEPPYYPKTLGDLSCTAPELRPAAPFRAAMKTRVTLVRLASVASTKPMFVFNLLLKAAAALTTQRSLAKAPRDKLVQTLSLAFDAACAGKPDADAVAKIMTGLQALPAFAPLAADAKKAACPML
jgi:hypothetical protein